MITSETTHFRTGKVRVRVFQDGRMVINLLRKNSDHLRSDLVKYLGYLGLTLSDLEV